MMKKLANLTLKHPSNRKVKRCIICLSFKICRGQKMVQYLKGSI